MSAPHKGAGEDRFRILSLDGGGIRGVYTASVLATIEEWANVPLVDHFDLIAGTSTGGIIAIGLGLGLTAREMLKFYEEEGPKIFPITGPLSSATRTWKWWRKPKYDAKPLDQALREVFHDRRLGESKCRLVIPSFDPVATEVHVFKTAHHPQFRQDHLQSAVDVARATSAAPTYFESHVMSDGMRFLDGGLWANCPSTVALLEAIAVLDIPPASIDLLRVGTTTAPQCYLEQSKGGGVKNYVTSIKDLLLGAQEAAAWSHTRLLTRDTAMLINHAVGPADTKLDDARSIERLRQLGAHDGRHSAPAVAARFLLSPVRPFTPAIPLSPSIPALLGKHLT
ncbi:CBASS cGAMP-activated phospholipase [soil metagenome]